MTAIPTYRANGGSVAAASGLAALGPLYDGFVLDLWGCLHNGIEAYPGVVPALYRLKEAGKRLVILSNAPRRASVVQTGMARIGIVPELYDHLLSSGELAWRAIVAGRDGLGQRCLRIGPERDLSMVEGNGLIEVERVAEAEFLLVTGPREDHLGLEDHQAVLDEALARGLPLLCANPDLDVLRGPQRMICAGTLARYYEQRGGRVLSYGKPFAATYVECQRLLAIAEAKLVLAVGDSLHTDIAGAQGAGFATALIPGGIHGERLGIDMGGFPAAEPFAALCAEMGVAPDYLLARFAW